MKTGELQFVRLVSTGREIKLGAGAGWKEKNEDEEKYEN
jgi:hypothetical protein